MLKRFWLWLGRLLGKLLLVLLIIGGLGWAGGSAYYAWKFSGPVSTEEEIPADEAALTTWVAHRSHRALAPLFARLHDVSEGAISIAAMWNIVGAAVVGASTQVPLLAGSSELTSMCRGQAILDALVGFGLPVRGSGRNAAGKALLN